MTRRAKMCGERHTPSNASSWNELKKVPKSSISSTLPLDEAQTQNQIQKVIKKQKEKRKLQQTAGTEVCFSEKTPGTILKTVETEENAKQLGSEDDEPKLIKKKKLKKLKPSKTLDLSERSHEIAIKKKMKKKRKIPQASDSGLIDDETPKKKHKKEKLDKNFNLETPDHSNNQDKTVKNKKNFKNSSFAPKSSTFYYNDMDIWRQNSLDDINKLIEEYKAKGLSDHEARVVLMKWKKREKRRMGRAEDRKSNVVCYNCRETGHTVAQCSSASSQDSGVGLCFKCGSTEHTVKNCSVRVKGFPYATCFVCNETGHLSRECPANPNGIFPKGGKCKQCGSINHLVKDCPDLAIKTGNDELFVQSVQNQKTFNPDEDVPPIISASGPTAKTKKTPKVVKI